jgi:hypothetical protein
MSVAKPHQERIERAIWLALVMVILAGCSSPTPTTAALVPTVVSSPSGLDSPLPDVSTGQSPVPTPIARETLQVQPSDPGLGTVKGQLIWPQVSSVVLGELFLAKALPTSHESIMLPSLDTETAPKAVLNRTTGEFAFVNVPPDIYTLVVWDPFNSALINDSETGETIFITVQADQVIDMGTITPLGG